MSRLASPLCVAILAVFILPAHSFYLPGVNAVNYADGDELEVKVNKITSTKTQLPFDYYHLPFCKPDSIEYDAENLGSVLQADRASNSLYKMDMRKPKQCQVVCRKELEAGDLQGFSDRISEEYRVNMMLDYLPLATPRLREEGEPPRLVKTYQMGYSLGQMGGDDLPSSMPESAYLNNHLSFTVLYHEDSDFEGARVVGFEVEAISVQHKYEGEWNDAKPPAISTCDTSKTGGSVPFGMHVPMSVTPKEGDEGKTEKREVIFTYDVQWRPSPIQWASRWDLYLLMEDDQIHWFSIINSLMIVLFLTGMVAMIMMRTLNNDLRRYEQLETSDEAQEESGWKIVHGDVFRPPSYGGFLSVLVGTGTQLVAMTLLTLVVALLGVLSPANRGALLNAFVGIFVVMSGAGGYTSARMYKSFQLTAWKTNAIWTALFFPTISFFVFFVLDIIVWAEQSVAAVPFTTIIALWAIWFGVSLPLVLAGSFFGYRRDAVEPPVRVNKIPRQIPTQLWYMHTIPTLLMGGILPFGAVFIELFFILSSIWLHQFYYVFGFLFVVFVILVITCAEISIVLVYFQLCVENYHW
eukprot:CAMPEP_0113894536 /NCGR_PEP_ID=MMETSP0780_2-20120614/16788_1 /TAXON_ID=652834 /ORGANISM="Palpitomonas bilix" /LENGTH=579 /DNA_ID=CAMNT_0000885119 /DNA_START=50 /DNA_END=1786 /DNA_ORIENTATION=- /assembly_acc=CAM_ASM_000599